MRQKTTKYLKTKKDKLGHLILGNNEKQSKKYTKEDAEETAKLYFEANYQKPPIC